MFIVEPMGRSGGLALLWQDPPMLDIYNYSRFQINAVVKDNEGLAQWKFIGFYGQPASARREESWELLNHLKHLQPPPWLCAGDFNEILEQNEKFGAAIRRASQMEGFRQALEDCELCDLGFIGSRFTWSNCRTDVSYTQERLDRAVANREWCTLFPVASVTILAACSSDHNPILVSFLEHLEERSSY
jgi:hypothetical protein